MINHKKVTKPPYKQKFIANLSLIISWMINIIQFSFEINGLLTY